MAADESTNERRAEVRTFVDRYFSVEFSKTGLEFIYQFRIWNISPRGMCIVVRQDSDVINHLVVGDVLEMKYYLNHKSRPIEYLRTEITHITRSEQGRFKDHCLVELSIL